MLPYYNDLTVLLSTIFKKLGFQIDYMGRPTKKTIEIATKYAPEAWCFDVKLLFGQSIEGIKNGNDLIIMPGAWGGENENCLLGCLTKKIMQEKLEKIAKKKIKLWFFNINCIEVMLSGYTSAYKNLLQLKKYSNIKFFNLNLAKAIKLGIEKMKLANQIREVIFSSNRVIDKNRLFSIYDDFIRELIFNADNLDSSRSIFKRTKENIDQLEKKEADKTLTIGLVGDWANTVFSFSPIFNIEKFLLSENIIIKQPLNFTNFYNIFSPIYGKKNRQRMKQLLPQFIGGSDRTTVLSSLYLKNKVDGLIHIRTFGCTPEEVASEVLISNKNIFPPMLSLSYDAHTTEENIKVRIEAFLDMLKSRRTKK